MLGPSPYAQLVGHCTIALPHMRRPWMVVTRLISHLPAIDKDLHSVQEIHLGELYDIPKGGVAIVHKNNALPTGDEKWVPQQGFGIKNVSPVSIVIYKSTSTDEHFMPGDNDTPAIKYNMWVPGTGKVEPLGEMNMIVAWFENLNLTGDHDGFAAQDQSARFPINYSKADNNAKTVSIPGNWDVAAVK